VQSKRSEVLFVDYIAEHLTPTGRAGIIVPEGIIFQSQNAYTQLRKMLVEEYLVAVVSLPTGVFNPYSGVKTSILILDKSLSKKANLIAFFKVDNDGFGLGAQRREIDKNDLPQAHAEITEYMLRLQAGESVADFQPTMGLIVEKEKVAANGDYNLSGERHREGAARKAAFPHVRLDAFTEIAAGNSAPQGDEYFKGGQVPFVRTSDVGAVHLSDNLVGAADKVNQRAIDELRLRLFPPGIFLFPKSGASTFLNHRVVLGEAAYVSSHLACIICDETRAVPKYVYSLLCRLDARQITPDQAYPSLRLTEIGNIEVPLPPLDVQKEIVADIEGYQKVIDGARVVLDNYRPHIPIQPDWPLQSISEVSERITKGSSPNWQGINYTTEEDGILFVTSENIGSGQLLLDKPKYVERRFNEIEPKSILQKGDVLTNIVGASIGRTAIFNLDLIANVNQAVCVIRPVPDLVDSTFMMILLNSPEFIRKLLGNAVENARANVSMGVLGSLKIPVPPLATQRAIVAEIEAEQALVTANRELIVRFEKKIQAALARVWGEDELALAEA